MKNSPKELKHSTCAFNIGTQELFSTYIISFAVDVSKFNLLSLSNKKVKWLKNVSVIKNKKVPNFEIVWPAPATRAQSSECQGCL